MLKRIKKYSELAVVLIGAMLAFGYTNLTTVGANGNNFANQINNDFNGTSPVSPLIDAGTVIQGGVAGKAGTSADQIGVTNALAQINKEVCVDGYGAVGDGVTDDATAIQAAIDACGSGCLVKFNCTSGVNTSKNYLLNHNAISTHGAAVGIQEWHSDTILDLNGATITSAGFPVGMGDGAVACQGCFEPLGVGGGGTGTLYAVTGATRGSGILTMVTPGQESNFTVGQKFYIEGEHTDYLSQGGGYIAGIDTTGHRLFLRNPLDKTYTPTPQVGVISYPYPNNIIIRNGHIVQTNASGTQFATAQFFVDGFKWENITLDSAQSAEVMLGMGPWNGGWYKDRFTTRCVIALDLSSRGLWNATVQDGVFSVMANANGTDCGSGVGSVPVSGTGESVANVSYTNSSFFNTAGSAWDTGLVVGAGAVNVNMDHNRVFLTRANINGGTPFSLGVGYTSGSPVVQDMHITNNEIVLNAGNAIVGQSSGIDIISGNNVTYTTTSAGECVSLSVGPAVVNGNTCNLNTQGPAIEIASSAAGSTITGNLIFDAGSSGATSPVIADNASNPSGDSVITGNVNVNASNWTSTGCTGTNCFVAIGSGHSNIIASRNSPSAQDTHP